MGENFYVLMTLHLKALMSKDGSCGFRAMVSIVDNGDKFDNE